MKKPPLDEANFWASGLSGSDWRALRDALYPFFHATLSGSRRNPARITLYRKSLPRHLWQHPMIGLLQRYRKTGRATYLDLAGRILCPTFRPGEKFGWFEPLAKMGGPTKL